ncbi:MAG: MlpA protein [Labilithrix sp.]|nr:MlpA protein [Labilithrix sp.]
MMTKTFAKGFLALALVGGVLASSYGCDQPKPKCAAARGLPFATVFTQTSGPASCADNKGEQFGISTYSAIGSNNRAPNLDIASIAIQPTSLGTLVENADAAGAADPDATHKTYALGFFATAEPENDFCEVPSLTNSVQNIPAYEDDPDNEITGAPATSVTYAWSKLRFYVTSTALGTQFTAELVKTVDGVACGYHVEGMWPSVDCSAPDPTDDTGEKLIADDSACAPEANIDAGRPTGSGISPDFPTKCDPDQLVCVLTKPVPALK